MAGPPEPGLVKGCTLERLRREGLVRVKLFGKSVGVLEGPDGRIIARELSCKHQGADLFGGERVGTVVTCPRHGWRYDLASGDCLWPADSASLREHNVVIEDGIVWLGLQPLPRDNEAW